MFSSVSPLSWFLLITSGIAFCTWLAYLARRHGVKRGMRQCANDHNFQWLGKEVPDSFLFRGTGISDPVVVDAMKGELHGTEMVVFTANVETYIGKSVSVRSQTVVAFPNVHGIGSRQIPPTGDANLYLEVAGEWFVLYQRGAVVAQDKLAGWCERMFALTEKAVSEVRAKAGTAPAASRQ